MEPEPGAGAGSGAGSGAGAGRKHRSRSLSRLDRLHNTVKETFQYGSRQIWFWNHNTSKIVVVVESYPAHPETETHFKQKAGSVSGSS